MSFFLKTSLLIPAIPIVGSLLIGLLLVSFNRTINRLTKPLSLFLIFCASVSTALSLIIFLNDISANPYDWEILLAGNNIHFGIYLDLFIDKLLLIATLSALVLILISYYKLDRRKGYVRYLSIVSGVSGFFFLAILNGLIPSF